MTERAGGPKNAEKAAEVCSRFDLGEEARNLLRPQLTADAYLDLLRQHNLWADAVRFLAHWLPKREAVWWGCLCAWKVSRPNPPVPEEEALEAAVHWVLEPGEKNRQGAEKAGRAAGAGTPAGGIALAASWSNGSMAPPGLPDVAPPPFLTARLIAGALGLAAALGQAANLDGARRLFVELGLDVAGGKNRWQ